MKDSSRIFDNWETSPPVDFWHGHISQLVMMRILKKYIGPAIYYIIQKGLGGKWQSEQFERVFGLENGKAVIRYLLGRNYLQKYGKI